ncbi:hypothetical protein RSAG8_13008, partial [Rhizoctonia solani AG-8 WAC10335]
MASPHDIGDRVRLRIVGIELQPNMSKRTIKADLQIDGKVVHELPAIDAGQLLKWSKLMVSDVYSGSRAELVVYQRHHGIYSRFASESWLISEIMQSSTKKLTITIEDKQYTAEIQVLDQTQAAKSFAKGRAKLMQMKQGGGVPDKLTATRRVFESMLRFGNVVAEILPAAKMAFVVCASAWERVEEQHKSNDELEDLTGRLNGMGPLVEEVEKHAQLRPLLRTIEAFLVLIEDVSIFVLERGTKGFGVRVLKSFIDSSDRMGGTEELGKRFRKIKDEFDTAISVQTMAIVARAYEQKQLKRLRHAESNGYDPSRGCQDGTRLTVLDDIDRWIQDRHPSPPFIRLSERGAPAIPFFCKRDDPTLRDPKLVAEAIGNDPELCSSHLGARYEGLLKKPHSELKEIPPPSPFLLVIDALDECGVDDTRRQLLGHLSELSSLVPWLKVIVTSRPDSDIRNFFHQVSPNAASQCALRDYAVADDIRAYIEARLGGIATKNQLPADSIDRLSIKAGELFIWAATACRLVLGSFDPEERLQQLLEGNQSEGALGHLDSLYATVIKNSLMDQEEDSKKYVRQCIGTILAASSRQPLPMNALEKLMRAHVKLGRIGAIRVIHPSSADFALNERRSGDFRVDPVQRNIELSTGCMSIMENELQFNMCKLETSHLLNSEVPDLESKVDKKISQQLAYSCIYWVGHLLDTTDQGLADRAGKVIDGPRLLYWLEVLSLLQRVDVAVHGLHELHQWLLSLQQTTAPYVWDAYRFAFAFIDPIAASAPHIYLSALALAPQRSEVFRRLSPMFPNVATIIEGDDEVWPSWLKPMAHPMPITSLCVSPNGQRLVTNCTDESKPVRVFDLRMGAFLRTLDHSAASYSGRSMHITISPNSTTIASISEGREVMFWDINTGAVIHSLHIEGSDDEAMSLEAITFSFDGASLYILAQISDVSDSKNQLIIWETGPGEPTKASFLQDLENDTCVNATAFSPDRTHVAVGDTNGRLLIIPRPGLAMVDVVKVEIEYSTVVIVFSPDGSLIATAGDPDSESISSCTVQLWDARTGGAVGGALMGHIGRVHSIAFSVDGSRMVTGSSDCTVRMWDSQTRDPIGGPFRGHWKDVCSVAFSPDSAYIISGSWDSTVLMWDASASSLANSSSTHEPSDTIVATYPLHKAIMEHYTDKVHKPSDNFNSSGHSGWVNSVLFSLDNTRIISGSGDGTVRTWETQTGLAIETLLSVVQEPDYMAQSSDGNFAIAASGTNGAGESCVWNVKTGAQLPIPPDHVYKCALSPDGTRLITGIYSFDASSAGMVVWDSNSGNMIKKLEGIQSNPEFIAFELDGSYMFSHHLPPAWSSSPSSSSNTPSPPELERKIFIWDPSTYDLVGSWGLEDNLEPVKKLSVSPDGSYLISHPYSGPSIFIHDAQTGNEIKDPLVGHTSSASVCCIAFSPDGAWMASGSGDPDNTIQLWDVKMGSPRSSPLVGHLDAVLSVAFSPDGTKLVSGSADKTIRVWDISADGPGALRKQRFVKFMNSFLVNGQCKFTRPCTRKVSTLKINEIVRFR